MKIPASYFYKGIILVSVAVIAWSVHYLYGILGGYEKVTVYEIEGTSRVVIGKSFIGRQTDPTIERYFSECREMISSHSVNGTLSLISYLNDTLDANEVDFFIGIAIEGEMAEVPQGFRVKEMESGKRLAVYLAMHPMVRPSPADVRHKLFEKGRELGLSTSNFIYELHYPDNSMVVEAWIE
ncbi:MAG: hypothetical protein OEY56_07390 [Cyclobacteriaceae bacterium]|nr:hypothetical protein [Cyclobacteriaceae bacterium]